MTAPLSYTPALSPNSIVVLQARSLSERASVTVFFGAKALTDEIDLIKLHLWLKRGI